MQSALDQINANLDSVARNIAVWDALIAALKQTARSKS